MTDIRRKDYINYPVESENFNLEPGMYFIRAVIPGAGIYTKKIIKYQKYSN